MFGRNDGVAVFKYEVHLLLRVSWRGNKDEVHQLVVEPADAPPFTPWLALSTRSMYGGGSSRRYVRIYTVRSGMSDSVAPPFDVSARVAAFFEKDEADMRAFENHRLSDVIRARSGIQRVFMLIMQACRRRATVNVKEQIIIVLPPIFVQGGFFNMQNVLFPNNNIAQ